MALQAALSGLVEQEADWSRFPSESLGMWEESVFVKISSRRLRCPGRSGIEDLVISEAPSVPRV